MRFANGVTVTVLPRVTRDAYGDPVPAEAEGHVITECAIAPRASADTTAHARDGVTVQATVLLPIGADLLGSDSLTVNDPAFPGTWVVDGDVQVWRSVPSGNVLGILANVRKGEG